MSPRARRRLLIALTVVGVVLVAAPVALASAGGGTAGFSPGGDGGGGGGGKGFAIYLIIRLLIQIAIMGHGKGLIVLLILAAGWYFFTRLLPRLRAAADQRRRRGPAARRETRRRAQRVETAAAEAADEDSMFAPDKVRHDASQLFTSVQSAWDRGDRIALRGLVGPRLLDEWERRLDEFDRQGWRNHSEPLGPPKVEYVGILRGSDGDIGNGATSNGTTGNATTHGGATGNGTGGPSADDRVVVRIEARIRDYVTDQSGRHIKRTGSFTETVRLREFWTLERRDTHWILSSIEQGSEGRHSLHDQIVTTAWSDEQKLRDEAMVEAAAADAVPAGVSPDELVDVEFATDAQAAANDLGLADGRFATDILQIAARRAVAAWATAIDGSTRELRAVAEPSVIPDLLHPGDSTGRTRIVVRGPRVERIEVTALDPAAHPPTMTIDVQITGRRWVESRATTQVLSGDPTRDTKFTEHWTFALTNDADQPWRIVAADAPAVAA